MTGITSSISNLVSSIFQTIVGLVNTVLSAFQGVLSTFATVLTSIAELAKDLVNLILGNIIIIGVVVAALVGYTAMQQRRGNIQGGSVTKAKKRA